MPALLGAVLLATGLPAVAGIIDSVDLTVGITDAGAPSAFSFSVQKPIGPLTGLLVSTLAISGTLTDGAGDPAGVAVSAVGPFLLSGLINGSELPFGIGPDAFVGGPYGPFSLATVIDAAAFGGGIASFGALLAFTGSGDDDLYTFTVSHTLATLAAPEPASLALIVAGLLGAGRVRARRHA
ncbi:MAG: PEP-CTERM sorting domain-containing protein [Gammaproteobacteria bacterium]